MKKLVKLFPSIALLAGFALLSGCAAVCGTDEQTVAAVPPPPPAPAQQWQTAAPVTPAPAPAPSPPTTYTVEKCDDLWSISAKPQIYNEPYLWPCILKANSTQIPNANRIKEGMVLTIPRDLTDADKATCRDEANRFPKYVVPAGAKRYCPPK